MVIKVANELEHYARDLESKGKDDGSNISIKELSSSSNGRDIILKAISKRSITSEPENTLIEKPSPLFPVAAHTAFAESLYKVLKPNANNSVKREKAFCTRADWKAFCTFMKKFASCFLFFYSVLSTLMIFYLLKRNARIDPYPSATVTETAVVNPSPDTDFSPEVDLTSAVDLMGDSCCSHLAKSEEIKTSMQSIIDRYRSQVAELKETLESSKTWSASIQSANLTTYHETTEPRIPTKFHTLSEANDLKDTNETDFIKITGHHGMIEYYEETVSSTSFTDLSECQSYVNTYLAQTYLNIKDVIQNNGSSLALIIAELNENTTDNLSSQVLPMVLANQLLQNRNEELEQKFQELNAFNDEILKHITRANITEIMLRNHLQVCEAKFSQQEIALDKFTQAYPSGPEDLAAEINRSERLMLESLKNRFVTLLSAWTCDLSMYFSGDWVFNSRATIGAEIDQVLDYVNRNVLSEICLEKDDFESYLMGRFMIEAKDLRLRFVTLGVHDFVNSAFKYYFDYSDSSGITIDDWRRADYSCRGLPANKKFQFRAGQL